MKNNLVLLCLFLLALYSYDHRDLLMSYIEQHHDCSEESPYSFNILEPDRSKTFNTKSSQKRIALVIGNADYQCKGVADLPTDLNDAEDMASTLQGFGFKVLKVVNANKKQMKTVLAQFNSQLSAESEGLFYYSGHGFELSDKTQYIIPVNANLSTNENTLKDEALAIDDVFDTLKNKARLKILILDACRNNPATAKGLEMMGNRFQKGFSEISAAKGMLIASSTARGLVSFTGNGRNSTYTGELLTLLKKKPGDEISLLLRDVGTKVKEITHDGQQPWISASYDGRFSFVASDVAVATNHESESEASAPTNLANEPEMVELPDGSRMGRYEITIAEYMECVNNGGCRNPQWLERDSEYNINTGSFKDHYAKIGMSLENKRYPITGISWDDATGYATWLSTKTGKNYRLPTAEEWFKACQADKETDYCGSNNLDDLAWYESNSEGTIHEVGQKNPNVLGLYDMSGNAGEWTCSDYSENDEELKSHCSKYSSNPQRFLCGGSWGRTSFRSLPKAPLSICINAISTASNEYFGFRIFLPHGDDSASSP